MQERWRKPVESQETGDGLTFEQAFTRLEDVVRQLEGGQPSLDRAIELYEEGMKLSRHCDAMLRHAQLRVSKLQSDMSSAGNSARWGEGPGDDSIDAPGGSANYGAGGVGSQNGPQRGVQGGGHDGGSSGRGPGFAEVDDDDQSNLPW